METVGSERGYLAQRFCFALHSRAQTIVQIEYRDLETCATCGQDSCSVSYPRTAQRRESRSGFLSPPWIAPRQVQHRKGTSKSQPGFFDPPRALEESTSFFRCSRQQVDEGLNARPAKEVSVDKHSDALTRRRGQDRRIFSGRESLAAEHVLQRDRCGSYLPHQFHARRT